MIRRTDFDLQAKKSWKTSMRCSHLLCALYIADRFNSPPQSIAQVALHFGVSTAMIFAVILWFIQIRFKDLKD
jgi:hypothetical protein